MMKIDRIKWKKLDGIGSWDWIFPGGSVLVLSVERSLHKLLGESLLTLFYEPERQKDWKNKGLKGAMEVWLSGENTRFHLRRDFEYGDTELKVSSTLEDEGEQKVSWPDDISLGEFLFQLSKQAFGQSVLVDWPEKMGLLRLNRLLNNLRLGGDEKLSLNKVRSSLTGAQKKLSDQKGAMAQVKAEYDALRQEWEAVQRQQEEERWLQIEIQNLQENDVLLGKRITEAKLLLERIDLLKANPDYRVLRKTQEELSQLGEHLRTTEEKLHVLTSDAGVDWSVLEDLREECIEWVALQEQVDRLEVKVQRRKKEIAELQEDMKTSGYDSLAFHEYEDLRRAEMERNEAQLELNKLPSLKVELERIRARSAEELAKLQAYDDMVKVTEVDEAKIELGEKRLKQWQNSKFGQVLDNQMDKHFSGLTVNMKLSSRLAKYCNAFNTADYAEFTTRLKEYRDQRKLTFGLQKQIEELQKRIDREDTLRRTVQTQTERLENVFRAFDVPDWQTWLNGWLEYQRKKQQLAQVKKELQLLQEQALEAGKELRSYAAQMREKLADWHTSATDRDEVLSMVFQVASQLRAKDETEKEIAASEEQYKNMLGDRNMDNLVNKLEPLADLERENLISDKDRKAELDAWENERIENHKQREEAEARLKNKKEYPLLSVLEKSVEAKKLQWTTYVELQSAIDDAQLLLDMAWQDWQTKAGKELEHEVAWILSTITSFLAQETKQTELARAKRDYFAYRLAIAQLSLAKGGEMPLLFTIGDGEVDDEELFWLDVLTYFRKLSLERQIIFITSDPAWGRKLPRSCGLRFI